MIHDIFLRWIVTALLVLYAGECLFVIAGYSTVALCEAIAR
jgi:hypothetical protein